MRNAFTLSLRLLPINLNVYSSQLSPVSMLFEVSIHTKSNNDIYYIAPGEWGFIENMKRKIVEP